MADDFVKEEVEDYKEEDNHFYSSVAQGFDNQHARLVIVRMKYRFQMWIVLKILSRLFIYV